MNIPHVRTCEDSGSACPERTYTLDEGLRAEGRAGWFWIALVGSAQPKRGGRPANRAWRPLPFAVYGDGRARHHQGCEYAQNPGLHEYMDPPGFCCALDGGSPAREYAPPSKGRGNSGLGSAAEDSRRTGWQVCGLSHQSRGRPRPPHGPEAKSLLQLALSTAYVV
jgi:hypothetical protein